MKPFAAVFITLFLFITAHTQTITWEKQFHFDSLSTAGSVIETQDSGFFELTNYIGNPDALWLIKLNRYGNILWAKIIDSAGAGVFSLIEKSPGIYMTALYSKSIYILEFNEAGDILWRQNYDPANLYEPYGLLSLNNGNYIITADLSASGKYPHYYTPGKMLIQNFNSSHNITWSDTFNFGLQTEADGIIWASDNEILISGGVGSGGINHSYIFALVLDSNGKKLNYVPYPALADSSEQVECVGKLKNGNALIESCSSNFGSFFFTLADSMGNTIRRWNIGAYHNGTGGFVTDEDSVLLLASAGLISGPLTLQKFDTTFHQLWEKQYEGNSYYNVPQQILKTADGGFLLADTRSTSTYSDMVLIKVDNNGYCADEDLSGMGNPDFPVKNVSIYPNPATNNIYINSNVGSTGLGIDIFDSRGVQVMAVKETAPGIQSLDISSLSKGLYMYRLYNESGICKEGKFVKE